MKKFFRIFVLLPVLASAGCVAVPEKNGKIIEPGEKTSGVSLTEMRRTGDDILRSMKEKNFDLFMKNLSGKFDGDMTKKDFDTSCASMEKQFGEIVSWKYELSLKTPVVRNLVWVVSFKRRNPDGSTTENELLFRLVAGSEEGCLKVMGFGFF